MTSVSGSPTSASSSPQQGRRGAKHPCIPALGLPSGGAQRRAARRGELHPRPRWATPEAPLLLLQILGKDDERQSILASPCLGSLPAVRDGAQLERPRPRWATERTTMASATGTSRSISLPVHLNHETVRRAASSRRRRASWRCAVCGSSWPSATSRRGSGPRRLSRLRSSAAWRWTCWS